jgi:phosphoglucomutase
MTLHALAGTPAPTDLLVDIDKLRKEYYARKPDITHSAERVSFGTSGHRGSSLRGAFNEAHVLAIAQAICEYRKSQGINGPLYIGKDTHALSEPAFLTALEVLAANGVETMIDCSDGYTPTPAVSHAILTYNRGRTSGLADGIVITPSHNPPEDGGFKYNPPHGGPADTDVTRWIENRANELLSRDLKNVARIAFEKARRAPTTHSYDYVGSYVSDLRSVVDMEVIRNAKLKIGVDPLGGAGVAYWQPIVERYGVDVEVVNSTVDPTFQFMSLDWDGKIRMDCSSPYAMAKLIALKDRFDIAFGNDTDSDRHGIVTRSAGLMNPNHYLAAAIFFSLPTVRAGARRQPSAKPSSAAASSTVWPQRSVASWSKCPWDLNGSCPACSTGRLALAEKRARALRFYGATARYGRPTRTASSWIFFRWSSWRAPAAIRPSFTTTSRGNSARRFTSASMRPRQRNRKRCFLNSRPKM